MEIFEECCEQFDVSDILEDKRVQFYIPDATDSIEDIMKKTCNIQISHLQNSVFCQDTIYYFTRNVKSFRI